MILTMVNVDVATIRYESIDALMQRCWNGLKRRTFIEMVLLTTEKFHTGTNLSLYF